MLAVLGVIGTFVAAIIVLLAIDKQVTKPRVRVYFWDAVRSESTKRQTLTPGKVTLKLFLRNEGDTFRLWKPAATRLTGYVYIPKEIRVTEIRRVLRADIKSSDVFNAGDTGRFGNMNYVEIPSAYSVRPPAITIVSYGEDVHIEIEIELPSEDREWPIMVQLISEQGDLGVDSLTLIGKLAPTDDVQTPNQSLQQTARQSPGRC